VRLPRHTNFTAKGFKRRYLPPDVKVLSETRRSPRIQSSAVRVFLLAINNAGFTGDDAFIGEEQMSKNKQTKTQTTAYDATYNLLRTLEMTTIFGNPGSTEQPFLKNFPKDFEYVLGLQEASVVAMADGFSQATNKPVLVNLHTAAGTGNGMGNIMTAYQNKTPLIITAGQQTREMILCEPYLTNHDETMLRVRGSSGLTSQSGRRTFRAR
jgi:hypothetical protein